MSTKNVPVIPKNKRPSKLLSRRNAYGYLFIAPFLIGLVIFVIVPFIEATRMAFSELEIGVKGYELTNIGLDNFDNIFFKEIGVTFKPVLLSSITDMLINVPLVVFFSFFIASVLNTEFKGRGVARSMLFLPVIITSGVITNLTKEDYMTRMMGSGSKYSSTAGGRLASAFINMISSMQLPQSLLDFIISSVGRVYDITVMSAVPIVIFLAALQSISPSLFEASYIEGATQWEVFWKIKFPMISPHILVVVVYCIIDSFNNISSSMIKMIHTTIFEQLSYGWGIAMIFSYMAIVVVILAIVYWFISRFVRYT